MPVEHSDAAKNSLLNNHDANSRRRDATTSSGSTMQKTSSDRTAFVKLPSPNMSTTTIVPVPLDENGQPVIADATRLSAGSSGSGSSNGASGAIGGQG